ncbi:SET domain-containing protein SmydA-8 [Condylostylus longicornis]|uniref:SET domain-containing protein SmydA-8 n=1 Tax=Condylostylus longicornis TaxID=2530218 RepID=UPI00244DBFDB|nr:SET domain-containing protein SmydA-8 [Condylostylus longicornis]
MANNLTNCPVCGVKASLKCGGCKNVVYCGKEHQKIHWKKEHKNNCKCFEISSDPVLGRYLRATKDIKQGDVILRESPLIYGPKITSYPMCLGCHKILPIPLNLNDFYKCSKCTWPLCGPQCEKSPQHIEECKVMHEKKFISTITASKTPKKESAYCTILPLRCIMMKKLNPNGYKQFTSLQDHLEERINTPLYKILKSNLVTFVKTILNLQDSDENEILKTAAILDTNSFEIRQPKNNIKIRALYPSSAMISHDCVPNTKHIFDDDLNIIFLATVDIPKGGTICTSYTQPLKSTLLRQEHLRQAKCFDCTCKRCMDPTELGTYCGAILCSKCKVGKIISTNTSDKNAPWKCELCPHQIPAKQIAWGNTAIQKEIENLDKKSPKDFEEFIVKYQDTLHEKNTHILQIKYALTQLYGNVEKFLLHELNSAAVKRKIDLCMELLDIADIFDPGLSNFRGLLLLDLQEIMALQTKNEFNEGLITKEDTQEKLMESMALLQEAVNILKVQPELVDMLQNKVENLSKSIEMNE